MAVWSPKDGARPTAGTSGEERVLHPQGHRSARVLKHRGQDSRERPAGRGLELLSPPEPGGDSASGPPEASQRQVGQRGACGPRPRPQQGDA